MSVPLGHVRELAPRRGEDPSGMHPEDGHGHQPCPLGLGFNHVPQESKNSFVLQASMQGGHVHARMDTKSMQI